MCDYFVNDFVFEHELNELYEWFMGEDEVDDFVLNTNLTNFTNILCMMVCYIIFFRPRIERITRMFAQL